ncbi:TetR family transcriptional regulator C-terminal domain-containing protein [Paracoccus aminophilus]|uniref:Transcriptional regulator, TetR family n=1 Tax=Paracoccus aminophilus JCM 7686 TaxID=1367847 RepID=S5YE61_PARAH|nr:TetR family transcriptional regulator C-terminal domain-containing protein [Paracoccus aminophilus]AGT09773.1 transcriptional regulator, TetR family [Paracoccus aminophilus JCM 7686]
MATTFRRMQDFDRRAELIRATLDCIADKGIQGTTVRAVATYAGVSNGLIRHHFASKENMILAAYRETVEMITAPGRAIIDAPEMEPHERLARFVRASIGGAVADPRVFSLWAAFIAQVNVDPEMARIHDDGHLPYRSALEPMIAAIMAAENRALPDRRRERLAIALNAVLDGLWLEGCLYKEDRCPEDYVELGLETAEALLGTTLPRIAERE